MPASEYPFPSSDPEFWRLPKVKQVVGFETSWIYHLIAEKQFPKQVPMGPDSNRVAWVASEVKAWVQARIDEARAERPVHVKRIRAGRKPNEQRKAAPITAPIGGSSITPSFNVAPQSRHPPGEA
jgi:prophage regulatory protein